MKLRYANHPEDSFAASAFNVSACCPDEVLTGDDSAYVTELEAFIEATGEWKNLVQAFKDHDIICLLYTSPSPRD